MKKYLFALVVFLLPAMALLAQQQNLNISEPLPLIEGTKQYQIYLDKPAKSFQNLKHKDGTLLKGELSEDGKRLIINNYEKRAGITVDVKYQDGGSESISRSPCYIDPVLPL